LQQSVSKFATATIDEVSCGKQNINIEDEKENMPAAALQSKLQQLQMKINPIDTARERAYTTSRPSSKASHRDEASSPVSTTSASVRRSRAETVPRTQSPTQLPTPPGSVSVDTKCMRKDIYEYEAGKKCAPVTRAVPS